MKILVTGSRGFIGKNLTKFLKEKKIKIIEYNKKDNFNLKFSQLTTNDAIVHLAGQNRSSKKEDFIKNNINLTKKISDFLIKKKLKINFIFSSSSHTGRHKNYIESKKECERILKNMQKKTSSNLIVLNLPNVFGKWSKPNYNSVIATFCEKISKSKKIKIDDRNKKIKFVYIDDVVNKIYELIKNKKMRSLTIDDYYYIKLGDLAKKIELCKAIFDNSLYFNTQDLFFKKLYSTYITFVGKSKLIKKIKVISDKRGSFSELIKDRYIGQISSLTIKKNHTRGNHYHNTKIERFFLSNGKVEFNLKNLANNKKLKFILDNKNKNFLEVPPGWSHNIRNLHKDISTLIVWSNEIYDRNKPDTYRNKIK